MPNASSNIRDRLLIRQHYLARLENGAIRDLVAPYITARNEIITRLAALEQFGTGHTREWQMARLSAQLAEIEQVLNVAAAAASSSLEDVMVNVATVEGQFQTSLLNSQLKKIRINVIFLPYKHIDYVIANPLLGESVGERLLWTNREAIRLIKQALTQSVISGEDMNRAARRLVNAAGTGDADTLIRGRASMIARSELQYVSNQVARSIYNENQDVIKGVSYTATLDNRTCLRCARLDGKVYRYVNGVDHQGPILPRHPNCRCVYVPVIKSWKELGISADEFPPSTRASFNGQVPDTMTYQQWFKTQDKEFQLDVLGPKKYEMFQSKKLTLKQMATDNKVLSIDELEDKIL